MDGNQTAEGLTLFRTHGTDRRVARAACLTAVAKCAFALAAFGFCLCACGPVTATSVIDDAEVALLRAHAAEGEKYALYETTLADLYLQKAKEEQGHARYADARELADNALRQAQIATRKAAERRTSDTTPAPRATIQHEPVTPADKPVKP